MTCYTSNYVTHRSIEWIHVFVCVCVCVCVCARARARARMHVYVCMYVRTHAKVILKWMSQLYDGIPY